MQQSIMEMMSNFFFVGEHDRSKVKIHRAELLIEIYLPLLNKQESLNKQKRYNCIGLIFVN